MLVALTAATVNFSVNQAAEAAPAVRPAAVTAGKVVTPATITPTEPTPVIAPKPIAPKPIVPKPVAPKPVAQKPIGTKTVTETKPIRFATRTVKDDTLAQGFTKTRSKGVDGVRTLTYKVMVQGGKEIGRKLIMSVVTRKPVTKVVAVGTKSIRRCDPNYRGACVPIASDVDCTGGKGNGPAYVRGPVRVVGTDIYDLDRDGDGIGCN